MNAFLMSSTVTLLHVLKGNRIMPLMIISIPFLSVSPQKTDNGIEVKLNICL